MKGLKLDVANYVDNVRGRFEALLRFTLPDVVARFDRAIEVLRKPADQSAAVAVRNADGEPLGAFIANIPFDHLHERLKAPRDPCVDRHTGAAAFREAPLGAPPPKVVVKEAKAADAAAGRAANARLAPAWAFMTKRKASPAEIEAKIDQKRKKMTEAATNISKQGRSSAVNRVVPN